MRNNASKLSTGQIGNLPVQSTKMEIWINGIGMGISKVIFWIIIFLSIIVESNGQAMTFAKNDINQTPMGVAVYGNILTNDSDPTNDEQWLKSVTFSNGLNSQHPGQIGGRNFQIFDEYGIPAGDMSIYEDGSYEYNPAVEFIGEVLLRYIVEDASGATDAASLVIQVIPLDNPIRNNRPIAHNDTNTTEMDTEVMGNLLSNDFDIENDDLIISEAFANLNSNNVIEESFAVGTEVEVYGKNMSGYLIVAGMIMLSSDGSYTFNPLNGFSGKISIEYKVSDGNNGIAQANLTILVLPDIGNYSFANDDIIIGRLNTLQSGNVLNNDQVQGSDFQTVIAATCNRGMPLVIDGTTENELRSSGSLTVDTDGSFIYLPRQGFLGTESLTYVICDNTESASICDTATLYLTTIPFSGLNIGIGTNNHLDIDPSDTELFESNFLMENISIASETFTLYPNPGIVGDDFINLEFKSITGKAQIQIVDVNGRLIRRLMIDTDINRVNNLEINVADLIEGRYHLKLVDGTNAYTETFIRIDKY